MRICLFSKPNQGKQLDVLHVGFDELLARSLSEFSEWYQNTEQIVNKVFEQCARIMWVQYIAGSAKFLGVRIRGISRSVGVEKGDIAMIHCCVYMVTRTVTLTAAHQATTMTQDPARHQTQ